MTVSRRQAWNIQKVNLLDWRVEPGILDVCTALNLLGMPTWESCEGHYRQKELHGRMPATPWVVVSAEYLPQYKKDRWEYKTILECANSIAKMVLNRRSKKTIQWNWAGTEPGGLSSAQRKQFDAVRADVFAVAGRKGWHEKRCRDIREANQRLLKELQTLMELVPPKEQGQLMLSASLVGGEWQSFISCEVTATNGVPLKPGLEYPPRERKALCLEGRWLFERFGEELRRYVFEGAQEIVTPVRTKPNDH